MFVPGPSQEPSQDGGEEEGVVPCQEQEAA